MFVCVDMDPVTCLTFCYEHICKDGDVYLEEKSVVTWHLRPLLNGVPIVEGGECDSASFGHRGRRGVRCAYCNPSWKEGSATRS